MLRHAHHGNGLVHAAGVGEHVVVAALPVILVVIAGGWVGEQVKSIGNLGCPLRVVVGGNHIGVVRQHRFVGGALGAHREHHKAVLVLHVLPKGGFEVVLVDGHGDVAVDEGGKGPVPVGAFRLGHLISLGHLHNPVGGFQEGILAGGVVVIAVFIHLHKGRTVGSQGHVDGAVLLAGGGVHVNHAVVVGVPGNLFAQLFIGFPGPGAVFLHVIQALRVHAGFFQQAFVKPYAVPGFGHDGPHAIDGVTLACHGFHALVPFGLGEIKRLQGGQVIQEAVGHGGGQHLGAHDENVVLRAAGGDEVGQEIRVVIPARDGHLLDGEVVGFLNPLQVFRSGFLLGGFRLGNFTAAPPVANDHFNAA